MKRVAGGAVSNLHQMLTFILKDTKGIVWVSGIILYLIHDPSSSSRVNYCSNSELLNERRKITRLHCRQCWYFSSVGYFPYL